RAVIGRIRTRRACTRSSMNSAASAAIRSRPLAINMAISQRLMSAAASGPWAPAMACRAREERRFGSSASWIRTCVSITTTLGVPRFARRAHDVADARGLAQRFEPLAGGRLAILLRHDARNHPTAHGYL